jgi:hypothetical protein
MYNIYYHFTDIMDTNSNNKKPIKGYKVGDKFVRIMNTTPKIIAEQKNIAIIGKNTTTSMITNIIKTNISKYCDVFCYHQSPWSIIPTNNLSHISHFFVYNNDGIQTLENNKGKILNLFATSDFIQQYGLDSRKDELKIINIIPLESIIELSPIEFGHIKGRILTENEYYEYSYAIAMTFTKNRVFHFDCLDDGSHYKKPEQHVIIGKMDSFWCNKKEDQDHFQNLFAPIILIQQYYIPKTSVRRKEINFCMKKNIHSGIFDEIYLLNEKIYDKFDLRDLENPIVKQININRRVTYLDVFKFAKETLPKHTYVVLCNSDIYLTESIYKMFLINMDRTFISLLRYDMKGDMYDKDFQQIHIFGPCDNSQDTWIFKVNDNLPIDPEMGFNMGVRGCDNAINTILLKKKYRIINPALSIQTIHVHMSEQRTYSQNQIVYQPFYTMIKPHGILPLEQVDGKKYWIYKSDNNASYNQPYPYYSQEIRTFMNYAKKKHGISPEFNQSLESDSYTYNNVYAFQNVFCDNTGFVYNRDQYFTTHPTQNIRDINILKRKVVYKDVIMLCQDGDNTDVNASGLFWFIKSTLTRLLYMCRSSLRKTKMILNINNELLKYINGARLQLDLVKAMPNQVYFANSMYMPMPSQELNYPKERLELFKQVYNLGDWNDIILNENDNINVLIVRDMQFHDTEKRWEDFMNAVKYSMKQYIQDINININYDTVNDLESNYFDSVSKFKKALFVFGHRCEIMANVIFCNKRTHVIECAFESTPDLQLWNLCAAAEHNYTLISYKREPKERQCFMVCKKLKQAFEDNKYASHFYPLNIEKEIKMDIITNDDIGDSNINMLVNEYTLFVTVNEKFNNDEMVSKFIHMISYCNSKKLFKMKINITNNLDGDIKLEYGDKKKIIRKDHIPDIFFEDIFFNIPYKNLNFSMVDNIKMSDIEERNSDNEYNIKLNWTKENISDTYLAYIKSVNWNQLYYIMSNGVIPILSQDWNKEEIHSKLESLGIQIGFHLFFLSSNINIEGLDNIDVMTSLEGNIGILMRDNNIKLLCEKNRNWAMNNISPFYIWGLIKEMMKG